MIILSVSSVPLCLCASGARGGRLHHGSGPWRCCFARGSFSLSQTRRFESVCGQRDQRREDELEPAPPRTLVRVSQGWSTRSRGPWSQNFLSNILEIHQSFHGHIPYLILLDRPCIQMSGDWQGGMTVVCLAPPARGAFPPEHAWSAVEDSFPWIGIRLEAADAIVACFQNISKLMRRGGLHAGIPGDEEQAVTWSPPVIPSV